MTRTRPRAGQRMVFVVLTTAVGAYGLLQSLILPVLPTIQLGLHTSQTAVTWVLTAYLLSASVFTPILGRVGDIVGKDRMLVVTLGVLAVGSLVAALATSITVMIIARVIQGVGGAVIPLAFGIIRDEFPRERVAGAVGTAASLVAVGAGLGIVLAGPIVNAFDYHWLFWIPTVIVVLAAVAAHLFVPESPIRTPGRPNLLAGALLSGWLVALLVAVSEGPVWGWGSGRVLGLFAVSVVITAGWMWVEARSSEPLIDMRMMRVTAVWTTNLVAFLFGFGMYSVFVFLPEFLQTPRSTGYGFGASVTQSGLFIVPQSVAMLVLGLQTGRLTAAFGSKMVVVGGSILGIVPYFMLAFAHSQRWEIYLASTLLGVSVGAVFSAVSSLIVEAVPAEQTGVASGMNANIRTIGGAIGSGVVASVVTSHTVSGGLPREAGYTLGFAALGVAAIIAAVAALLIPTARRTTQNDAVVLPAARTARHRSAQPVSPRSGR
jgi:MFS family permease